MAIVSSLAFIFLFFGSLYWFASKMILIRKNILLGRDYNDSKEPFTRFKIMCLFALGQRKMFQPTKWIPAVLHLFIYLAFIITQIELIEVIIDGVRHNHRAVFHFTQHTWFNNVYVASISLIEVLSLLALVATLVFLVRRNILKINRFQSKELSGFPRRDANLILLGEIFLISCIFLMNTTDVALHPKTYNFLLSDNFGLYKIWNGVSVSTLEILERIGWWGHIIGILGFMLYLPFSKHLHIFLAFPNAYYGPLNQEIKGHVANMPKVSNEVKLMLDPNATIDEIHDDASVFGAKDVKDLTWKNLLDAYSCSECGRCTQACPANKTGKLLSPRKIMMDTRDRLEEYSLELKSKIDSTKTLLNDYISEEEINACTTCNACVEACPININPLQIILELRRYQVMEASKSPSEWNAMFSNIENNMSPWKFNPEDRAAWTQEN